MNSLNPTRTAIGSAELIAGVTPVKSTVVINTAEHGHAVVKDIKDLTFIEIDETRGRITIANNDFKVNLAALVYGILPSYGVLYSSTDSDDVKRLKDEKEYNLNNMLNMADTLAEVLEDVEIPEPISNQIRVFSEFLVKKLRELEASVSSELENPHGVLFTSLPHIFKKGNVAVFNTPAGKVVGTVDLVEKRVSMFGAEYYMIMYSFLRHNGMSFESSTGRATIFEYEERKPLNKMSATVVMTDEEKEYFIARGKKYVAYHGSPKYLKYEGFLVRKSWYYESKYESSGRVMVDPSSMTKMDPNYSMYFGGEFSNNENAYAMSSTGITDEDLMRMSPVTYGFSFKTKLWGELRIDDLHEIVFNKEVFNKVILDEERKALIKAVVSTTLDESADLIAGKGSGIIAMLHGSPGIGKTLTAEAVSETLERPLYMVGVGELGTDPESLENNLRQVLETAKVWNAVLLLDEADIFLERRTPNDIVRNAMVSIFLRLLEYYEGIMFLTTNRAANIDEAFYSRISLALHYEDLNEDSRAKIWGNSLKGGEGFDIKTLSRYALNGRQIKNCVNLATLLAKSKNRTLEQGDLEYIVNLSVDFEKVIKSH